MSLVQEFLFVIAHSDLSVFLLSFSVVRAPVFCSSIILLREANLVGGKIFQAAVSSKPAGLGEVPE